MICTVLRRIIPSDSSIAGTAKRGEKCEASDSLSRIDDSARAEGTNSSRINPNLSTNQLEFLLFVDQLHQPTDTPRSSSPPFVYSDLPPPLSPHNSSLRVCVFFYPNKKIYKTNQLNCTERKIYQNFCIFFFLNLKIYNDC